VVLKYCPLRSSFSQLCDQPPSPPSPLHLHVFSTPFSIRTFVFQYVPRKAIISCRLCLLLSSPRLFPAVISIASSTQRIGGLPPDLFLLPSSPPFHAEAWFARHVAPPPSVRIFFKESLSLLFFTAPLFLVCRARSDGTSGNLFPFGTISFLIVSLPDSLQVWLPPFSILAFLGSFFSFFFFWDSFSPRFSLDY